MAALDQETQKLKIPPHSIEAEQSILGSMMLDNRVMLFYSDRTGRNELFAYLADTGELVRLNREQDGAAGSAVASRLGDRIYVAREKAVYEWKVSLALSPKTKLESQLTESTDRKTLCPKYTFVIATESQPPIDCKVSLKNPVFLIQLFLCLKESQEN